MSELLRIEGLSAGYGEAVVLQGISLALPEGDTLDRTVDSHMSKLRKKLEHAGLKGVPESIRGMGYRLGENK